jgi:hypothetical protein
MTATAAKNTKLLNGEIRGFRALRQNADLSSYGADPVKRAVRVVDDSGVNPDTWLTFTSRDVDVVRSPLVNDTYDRYYWAGDGVPKYNIYSQIYSGSGGPYYLGIPTPVTAPTVTPPAGTDETRAYVYCFVTAYGEESAPSPPTVATGDAGTWALSNIDGNPDAVNRNITHVNIYRTVSGGNSSNFYYVDQITIGTTTYNDNETATTVAANNLMESTSFTGPPSDLEGMVVMPGGYLVGWAGRRIVFSEPYRPHAWPAEYELSTEFPVVGMVVWGSTLIIGTESQPYFGQGQHPASFTMRKMDAVEPCLSRRGMVATVAGAYYPSLNGLVLANSSGARVITQDIVTKEEWELYNPSSIFAAQLGLQYIAFTSANAGFIFNPTEPETKLVELEGFSGIEGVETDRYSGDVLILHTNSAWDWDPTTTSNERLNWRWQSKKYQLPAPVNLGAFRIQFETPDPNEEIISDSYYADYNTALFAAVPSGTAGQTDSKGLAPLNSSPLGGSPANQTGNVSGWSEAENLQPLNGSLLYPVAQLNVGSLSVRIQIKTGKDETVRYDRVIYDEGIYRLPAGFKADIWQINLTGNTDVYSVQLGSTPRSLQQV